MFRAKKYGVAWQLKRDLHISSLEENALTSKTLYTHHLNVCNACLCNMSLLMIWKAKEHIDGTMHTNHYPGYVTCPNRLNFKCFDGLCTSGCVIGR